MTKFQFHSCESAAAIIGLSTRSFSRIAADAGIHGLNFGRGGKKNYKWTDAMIDELVKYRAKNKLTAHKVNHVPFRRSVS